MEVFFGARLKNKLLSNSPEKVRQILVSRTTMSMNIYLLTKQLGVKQHRSMLKC